MYFPGLEKSLILGKVAEVMEKTCNFIFWSKYSVLFEIWKVIGQKYSPKRLGLQHFLVMENLNCSWK